MVEFSIQYERVSSAAGCVARAAQRSDHSRHPVLTGSSVISSPASRCPNAVTMSVARIWRDESSVTIACMARHR
ncbi:Uncharacterised protein [Mycobacterium tuberculosis]|uniref:Uncharacterized protein n=1 Tax=Mycobacterium tuberculosis TaxID=1773 RepID=A0A916PD31_MYCTX|nr:Uncharacterised protein [Mycobacterium tuberculosis]